MFFGQGRFVAADAVEVDGRRLAFKRAVVATGGRAAAPPIAGLESAGYLTNESVFALTSLPRRLAVGLAVNVLIAFLAWRVGSIDGAGAFSAIVIGTAITAGLGLPGLAVMIAFFVIGSAATKLGYRVKASRGIAQEKGGARGWRNAWANGGVPAALALLAAMVPHLRGLYAIAYAAAVATASSTAKPLPASARW